MRIKLPGLARVRKRLATGKIETYYYAWRGGPRITAPYGTADFVDSYNTLVKAKVAAPADVLRSLLDGFLDSSDFAALADLTKTDYRRHIRIIDAAFGDFPVAALVDPRTRGEFMAWRDRRALKSPRQADYSFAILARVLSWSVDRGLASLNPCKAGGVTYRARRTTSVWTDQDEAAFYAKAPTHLHLMLRLPAGQSMQQRKDSAQLACLRIRIGSRTDKHSVQHGKPYQDAAGRLHAEHEANEIQHCKPARRSYPPPRSSVSAT